MLNEFEANEMANEKKLKSKEDDLKEREKEANAVKMNEGDGKKRE